LCASSWLITEINKQNVNICIRNWDTNKDRQKATEHFFERKVYRRILGPVWTMKKENWRILTNKEIYTSVQKSTIIETVRLN